MTLLRAFLDLHRKDLINDVASEGGSEGGESSDA